MSTEMGPDALALLWLAWIVGGASPGPATLALAATGMTHGRRCATALAAGIVCGSAIWGVAAGLGLAAVMFANAWALEALRYAGAGYILWLAFKSGRAALRRDPVAQGPGPGAAPPRAREAFLKGAALHISNPKAMLSWGAVFAVAVPQGATPGDLAFFWAFLLSGSVCVFFGYARLFSTAGAMERYARLRRWFEGAFALLFGAAAVAILRVRPS